MSRPGVDPRLPIPSPLQVIANKIAKLRQLANVEDASNSNPDVTLESTATCTLAGGAGATGKDCTCGCQKCCLLNDVKRAGHYDMQWFYAHAEPPAKPTAGAAKKKKKKAAISALEVVGCAAIMITSPITAAAGKDSVTAGLIASLFVRKEWRGHGVATHLLQELVADARRITATKGKRLFCDTKEDSVVRILTSKLQFEFEEICVSASEPAAATIAQIRASKEPCPHDWAEEKQYETQGLRFFVLRPAPT